MPQGSTARARAEAGGVLYVLRYFPTLTETFVYREIDAVAVRVPVHAVAVGERADGALQDEPPEVVVSYPPRGLRAVGLAPALRHLATPEGRRAWRWLSRQQRPKDAARALWLADRARALGVTRLHAHFAGEAAEWALVTARLVGVPFGVTVHAADLFKPRPALGEVLRAADPVVAVAEHHRQAIAARYGVEATVVRCGVDPARFPVARPGDEGPLRLVSVARPVPKKGLDTLVAAVRAVPGVRLRLVADAPRWATDRVQIGALPPSEVPAALAAAHAFVLPCRVASDGDRDGVPVALLEAMAAGLPVITTKVAGIPEVVDEAVGWWVPPDDPEALAAVLREVAADPAERLRRGRAARERIGARGLTVEAQASGLLAAWGLA